VSTVALGLPGIAFTRAHAPHGQSHPQTTHGAPGSSPVEADLWTLLSEAVDCQRMKSIS
jgi:hypothetical protein